MPGRMEARDQGSGGAEGQGAAGIRRFFLIYLRMQYRHHLFTISLHVIHKANIEYILILNLKKIMERT